MREGKVTNSNTSRVIAQIGHLGKSSIGDAGTPVPFNTERTNLAISNGFSSFLSVLEDILGRLEVQPIELAGEIETMNPEVLGGIKLLLPDTPISFTPHEEMKKDLNSRHAFIHAGGTAPYTNIILVNGVAF